jgi:2-methylcitrate dehydratase PrpD
MSATLSEQLAAWFATVTWASLPEAQRELAQSRLLDALGLIACGYRAEAASIARTLALGTGGNGRATIAGSATALPPSWAALVHGVAAHGFDFDDTFPESVVHPGSVVVPVALAVGESVGASGAEMLAAIAGGYEIAARLGRAGGTRFHARGFHATGVFAPVTAAFVAARLLRLDAQASASAVGLAASMAGGLMAFQEDGSWSKWLHVGWGNFGGITAAQLAQGGFRGPAGALDGRSNLFAAFIGETNVDAGAITEGLGQRWDNATALFKLYPCAHVIQGYIDLALAMRETLVPATIERITCFVAPWAVPIVCEPVAEKARPKTMMQAIASLPLHVASALIDGRVDLQTIGDANRQRSDILALAAKVGYVPVAALEGFDARIEIVTADGRRHERSGGAAAADAARLRAKFTALASPALGPGGVKAVLRAVGALAEAPNADGISGCLSAAPAP